MEVILTLIYDENKRKRFHDFKITEQSWNAWCNDGSWPPELQTLSCDTMYGVTKVILHPVSTSS